MKQKIKTKHSSIILIFFCIIAGALIASESVGLSPSLESENYITISSVKKKKIYAYNESVPEEVILAEVDRLTEMFRFSTLQREKWEKILRCEATCTKKTSEEHGCEANKLDNLAQNPKSTAVGLGQYLIRTWYATKS